MRGAKGFPFETCCGSTNHGRKLPETVLFRNIWREIARHSPACIAMQVRRNHQGHFSGFGTGKGAGNSHPAAETR